MTIIDWCLDRLEPIYDLLADAYGLLDRFVEYVIEGLEDVRLAILSRRTR